MSLGQATKATFKIITVGVPPNPEIEYVFEQEEICKCCLNVFADPVNPDNLFRNDMSSFIRGYSDVSTGATMELLKCGVKIDDLINDDYGEFFGYGFHTDGVKSYIGMQLDWLKVYNAFGSGSYQMKVISTIYDGSTVEETSFEYNLQSYTTDLADGSVRMEFIHNGIIGDCNDPKSLRSFEFLNWPNQIRLRGMVYTATPTYEQEEIQYWNGMLQDVKNELTVTYSMNVRAVPNEIHQFLQVDVLQADSIIVSDYNSDSPLRPFLDRELKFAGGYERNQIGRTKKSSAKISFKDKINNKRKRFC